MENTQAQDWMLADEEIARLLNLGVEKVLFLHSDTPGYRGELCSVTFLRKDAAGQWAEVARLSPIQAGLIEEPSRAFRLNPAAFASHDWRTYVDVYRAAGSPKVRPSSVRTHVGSVVMRTIMRLIDDGLREHVAAAQPVNEPTPARPVYEVTLLVSVPAGTMLEEVEKALDALISLGRASAEATLEDEGNNSPEEVEQARKAAGLDVLARRRALLHRAY